MAKFGMHFWSQEERDHVYKSYLEGTEQALIVIFDYDEQRAKKAVGDLWKRFDDVPEEVRMISLHEGQVSLAFWIAIGKNPTHDSIIPYDEKIKKFQTEIEPIFNKRGREAAEEAERAVEARLRAAGIGIWAKQPKATAG